jgi:hypothetical protein
VFRREAGMSEEVTAGLVGQKYYGSIDYYGEVDRISFDLLPGVTYEATIDGMNDAAADVQAPIVVLSDYNNTILANSYSPGENPYISVFDETSVTFAVPVAGNYILNILDAAGTGDYIVDVSAYASDPFTGFF